jgi:hypothetical protein
LSTVPNIWTKVITSAGAKRWEGHYYIIGNVYGRHKNFPDPEDFIDNTTTTFVSSGTTPGGSYDLTFGLKTLKTMEKDDYIITQFPRYWPTGFYVNNGDCRVAGSTANVAECYFINNYEHKAYFNVIKLAAGASDGATIRIKVNTSMAVVEDKYKGEFWQWVYNKRRCVGKYRMTNFGFFVHNAAWGIQTSPYVKTDMEVTGQNLVDCNNPPPYINTQTRYQTTFQFPDYVLRDTVLRIEYPGDL